MFKSLASLGTEKSSSRKAVFSRAPMFKSLAFPDRKSPTRKAVFSRAPCSSHWHSPTQKKPHKKSGILLNTSVQVTGIPWHRKTPQEKRYSLEHQCSSHWHPLAQKKAPRGKRYSLAVFKSLASLGTEKKTHKKSCPIRSAALVAATLPLGHRGGVCLLVGC